MEKASRTGRRRPALVSHLGSKGASATVASLGVQARLVEVDPERERAFASLLEQYERLCQEWERLVHQAIHLLGSDFQPNQPGERPPAPGVRG